MIKIANQLNGLEISSQLISLGILAAVRLKEKLRDEHKREVGADRHQGHGYPIRGVDRNECWFHFSDPQMAESQNGKFAVLMFWFSAVPVFCCSEHQITFALTRRGLRS
jgi:hypothetical protein